MIKARAAILVEHGKPIVIDEIELPDPGPNHVVVKQFHSGVCHSQLHQLHNPQSVARGPILLGHESTGVVVATGADVTHVKEGDHVMLTWLPRNAYPGMPRAQMPMVKWRDKTLMSSPGSSTWAEAVIADHNYVVKLDNDLPTDVTAIVGCAVMTGCGAVINTARVRVGDSVAVYGVGGLGCCVVQACANSGAHPIIAIDLTDEKLEFARQFGATHFINAAKVEPPPPGPFGPVDPVVAKVREMTGGGADFAFDVIGVTKTMEQVVPTVRGGVWGYSEGGTAVQVGQPTTQPQIPIRDIFSGARTLRGSAGGTGHPDHDFPMYLRWFREGKLPLDKLVTRRFKFDAVNEACAALEKGDIFGRSVLEF